MSVPEILWRPQNGGRDTPMHKYREHINKQYGCDLKDSHDLHTWTLKNAQKFWKDAWNYFGLIPEIPNHIKAYDSTAPMSSIPKFFDGFEMNYSENVLTPSRISTNKTAVIEIREGHDLGGRTVTWKQLAERVRNVRSALKRCGIEEGKAQRVAAIVANSEWVVVLFLATASLGAVFTCIGPDLGAEGIETRLIQVTPTIIFADSDSTYKGKRSSVVPKLEKVTSRLEPKPQVYVIPLGSDVGKFDTISSFMEKASDKDELKFTRVPFSHPMIICYSSGTTGPPKCIVHQHGFLLNSQKVSRLHSSLGEDDVIMQYTTTTWVMFYISQGHLASGATIITYDGSPLWPDARTMMKILERHRVTYFGTSPRYLLELEQSGCVPKKDFNLSTLKMINTTGAPLSMAQYGWFYSTFPPRVHISNTAGGTDTATSLIASDPAGPLYAGEMQMVGLGMDIDVADPETGDSIRDSGEPGEMVIRNPFASMPPFFWGDEGNRKYKESYFERFDKHDLWAQHDWLQYNPRTKGWVMTGRSDGVLNPSGIRFGSGEIYAVVEGPIFNDTISNTLCVGRRRKQDVDEQVFLFVVMKEGEDGTRIPFTENLTKALREAIRSALSPRHVPKFIIEVEEIPVTINGKKVEVAVKSLISGRDIKISSTVANPECLRSFARFRELETPPRPKL